MMSIRNLERYAREILHKSLRQLHARKNLASLNDPRASRLFLDKALVDAAIKWPEIIPNTWKPDIIVDAGACKGDIASSLCLLYKPSHIILIEPLPHFCHRLRNRDWAPHQNIYECALGRENGKANLNIYAFQPSSSLLEINPVCADLFLKPMHKVDSIEVDLLTLDAVYDDSNLDRVDLLKLDVQGYELEILEGGKRAVANTRLIIMEVSFFEHYLGQALFSEVYEYMHGKNYELMATYGYSYDQKGIPLQCDALFLNKELTDGINT